MIKSITILAITALTLTACNKHRHNHAPNVVQNPPIVIVSPNNPNNPNGLGPAAVNLSSNGGILQAGDLGSAGNYVILAKTGVSNVTGSAITGNIGVSPAAASYITGFSLIADASNEFSTSSSVTGRIYAQSAVTLDDNAVTEQ